MTTATKSVKSVSKQIAAVRKSAEKMHAAEREVIGTASVGDVVRQGDLYLVCLETLPTGEPRKDRQLAPGTTQGSRHVLSGKATLVDPSEPAAVALLVNRLVHGAEVHERLVGPAFECLADLDVTHPEHGDKCLPQGSVWAVVYQRAFAEEVRRVLD